MLGAEVGQADFFCRPAGRGGHHLHQARGTHARARIHDEAAFLADEAIDVGSIQTYLARALQHRGAVGRGVALRHVHHAAGALTGVDAAVPHLLGAGKVGGGQQFTVGHATGLVQIGGVVPLAHALGTQAQHDGVQPPVQARVGTRSSFFTVAQGRRRGWHGHAAAQLFQGQLLVKTALAGNALEQFTRLLLLRRAGAACQQGPGAPVHPGAVGAGGGAHGVNRFAHLAPLPGTQRGTGLPGELVVIQVMQLADFGEVVQRIAFQALGAALANHAPHPIAFLGAQLRSPFVLQQTGCGFVVAGGQFGQGQHHQLAVWRALGLAAPGEVFGR